MKLIYSSGLTNSIHKDTHLVGFSKTDLIENLNKQNLNNVLNDINKHTPDLIEALIDNLSKLTLEVLNKYTLKDLQWDLNLNKYTLEVLNKYTLKDLQEDLKEYLPYLKEWFQTSIKVQTIVYQKVRAEVDKTYGTNKSLDNRWSGSERINFISDGDEVGLSLRKIPDKEDRDRMSKLNSFVFKELSKISDNLTSTYAVYLKLFDEGVLPAADRITLVDRSMLAVSKLPKKSRESLPKILQTRLMTLNFK